MSEGLNRKLFGIISVLLIVLASSMDLQAGAAFDITPPSLAGMAVSPGTVNVATGPQNVVLTFHITDDCSGFSTGSFALSSPSGQTTSWIINAADLVSGDAKDGFYDVTITFPQACETGLWTITSVQLKDAQNNAGYPDTGLLSGIQVISVMPDTTPPALTGFDVVPDHINVYSGAQTVTCTLHITDDIAGFDSGSLTVSSASGDSSMSANIDASLLKSGSANDGVYEFVLTFPQTSETGLWHVTSLLLTDKASNTASPDTGSLKGIQVTSESPDKTAPLLAGFNIAPYLVNVYTGAQTATCSFTITDDLSGFSSGTFTLSSPTGNQTVDKTINASILKSGSANDGVYEFIMTFPQDSETGTWRVTALELQDAAGNKSNLNLNGLAGIQVVSQQSDTAPPSLVRLQALTQKVNIYSGSKPGSLAIYIIDDLSGFSSGTFTLTSPSGNQTISGTVDVSQLLSGNKNAGAFKATVTFPQNSELGTWHVTEMQLVDEAGNAGNSDLTGSEGIEIISQKDRYVLSVSVIGGHGTVWSGGVFTYQMKCVIDAYPDQGYKVKAWTGTDNDAAKTNKNEVIMNTDRTVTVEFESIVNPEDNDNNNNNDNKKKDACFMMISGSSSAQSAGILLFMVIAFVNLLYSLRSSWKGSE